MPLTLNIYKTLENAAAFSSVIPFLVGLFYAPKENKPLKLFLIFTCVALIFDFISFITARNGINNLLLFYIYTLIEYVFIVYFLSQIIKNKVIIKLIIISTPLLCLYIIYYAFLIDGMLVFTPSVKSFEGLLISLFGGFYFLESYIKEDYIDMKYFWINLGILVYFMGSMFTFLFLKDYSESNSPITNKQLWMVHSFCNIIANLLYSLGFISNLRQHKLL